MHANLKLKQGEVQLRSLLSGAYTASGPRGTSGTPAANARETYYSLACAPTASDRGNKQLELALAFGSLGTRSLFGLFGPLGGLLWMLDRPLFVILLHFSIVSSPVEAESLLGVFCAFCRLLGVLRLLFAHGVSSFFPLETSGTLHCFFCCTRPEHMTQARAPTCAARRPAEFGPSDLALSSEGHIVDHGRRFFGGRGYGLAHCQGLLAHQQRCHPKLLGTRRDLGSLAGYPKIFALDLEPVCDLLEPPLSPLCKLFVVHLGFLLQRLSRILLREPPTVPRAPRCGSPQSFGPPSRA